MDWQEKYFEKLEREIKEIRDQLLGMEDRFEGKLKEDITGVTQKIEHLENKINDKIDQAVSNIVGVDKTRHDDYLAVNKRLDYLSERIDRTVTWAIRFSAATLVAVAGLVVTVLLS